MPQLLLNTLDTKRSLHRILMSTQAELSGSSSSSSGAVSPPSSPNSLSTGSLSKFGQELITLVNAGRLPATWVEEAETALTHSGVDSFRRASMGDLYESTRTVVRGIPDRQTDCHALTSATLTFLAELFHTDTALDLLYTNDIQVLVEVLIRKLEDEQDQLQLTLDYLLCLAAVVAWTEFTARPFKVREIRDLVTTLQTNYPLQELTAEQQSSLTEEERDANETKLAIHQLAAITQQKL
jgi:hypothetical protein